MRYALITVTGDNVAPPSDFMNEDDMSVLLGTLVLEGPKAAHGNAAAVISAAKYLRYVTSYVFLFSQFYKTTCNPLFSNVLIQK